MKKIAIILSFTLISCNEVTHSKLGKEYAVQELQETLANPQDNNFVDNKEFIIKDKKTAIAVSEPILFEIYGKSHIEDQKPYEVYLIKNYWVIRGTLMHLSFGGTFLIIIDARNSRVLRIIHGK
ncbi:YbbC/YhhH family protein [Flavobacterium reichenbachii]|uniref:YbbC/YhhH family protein n=1 Tax=Flavobacterium reichenbachii TaxID=362418 RepID=UPI0006912AB2|nr:YbbC/YhhH family protein [Flavobacterium reichenbachii]OXB11653.1 hypothetical protein B0A68_20645 [Flavobacterium reichenbachii]